MNKEVKGGVINIYPLETMDQIEQKAVPQSFPDEAKPLLQMVKLKAGADKRLTKLLLNMLSNVVMVKDYNTALTIAKQHGLTCVTPNLQVVYAGAFITKVG